MPHRVTWIRIGDSYPDLKAEKDHFLALDGKSAVGIVRRIEGRPGLRPLALEHGASPARKTVPATAERHEGNRSQAAKASVETWRHFRKWYGLED